MNERRKKVREELIIETIEKAVDKLENEYDVEIKYNILEINFY